MIDIKHFRDHPEDYEQSAKLRSATVDFAHIKQLDAQRLKLIGRIDELRAKLNLEGKPDQKTLGKLRDLKHQLGEEEASLSHIETELETLLAAVPNLLSEDTPAGGEEANLEVRAWGRAEPSSAKDHLSYMQERDWIDFERGAKVAGSKFYYLKNEAVLLEEALIRLARAKVQDAGFALLSVPHLVNERISSGTGFNPKGPEGQVYRVEGEDLYLIATAEIPLTGYHADEIIPSDQLPKTYAALSPSYRREAGAYGRHSKGLYRVHQFNKLELYVFCLPESSDEWLDKLVKLEEDIVQALEIPYRVTRTAAGDMGSPHYAKYDLEYFSPTDNAYRELTSASNCTDYQARRLNIRARTKDGNAPLHTLNATAIASSRSLVALIENHQRPDGKLKLPQELAAYFGANKI